MTTSFNREALRSAELMREFGGSFAKLIGSAYLAADPGNKEALLRALPHLFAEYNSNSRWGHRHEQQEALV